MDSLEAAIAAEAAGADRLELCTALSLGGLTPSKGLIEVVCGAVKIPVFVLLRPREGDFVYSAGEFEVMLRDAADFKGMGASGLVTGVLEGNGGLDVERTRALMEGGDLPVTFHRAFDHCEHPMATAEALVKMGVERILSSGQRASAKQGVKLLWTLVENFGKDISIMPGAGISPENICRIASLTGAREFHFSAIRPATKSHRKGPLLGKSNAENQHFIPHPEKVAAIRKALNSLEA